MSHGEQLQKALKSEAVAEHKARLQKAKEFFAQRFGAEFSEIITDPNYEGYFASHANAEEAAAL